jgi:hypothetical protein
MITVQPVLEIQARDDFALWPVAELEPWTFLPLGGTLTPDELGTAVMSLAACNDVDPDSRDEDRPPRPTDPLGGFLHGLLTLDPLFASGGLRVTDTATGTVLVPGCCSGLEDRGEWWDVVDGRAGAAGSGHDPAPLVERHGETVRLTVDAEADTSPAFDVPVTELRRLLTDVERELADFVRLAAPWTATHLPDRSEEVSRAISRALLVTGS